MGRMKAPTKAQLYEEIRRRDIENARLNNELNADRIKRWEERLPAAYEKARADLGRVFGGLLTLLKYEHCDASGYYFTFELINDPRRQCYRVNHDEI